MGEINLSARLASPHSLDVIKAIFFGYISSVIAILFEHKSSYIFFENWELSKWIQVGNTTSVFLLKVFFIESFYGDLLKCFFIENMFHWKVFY